MLGTNLPKTRIIAAEEHFVTDPYRDALRDLPVPSGEEPEQAIQLGFTHNAQMRSRTLDVNTRLAEMDAAGTDVSILGPTRRACRSSPTRRGPFLPPTRRTTHSSS